MDNILWADYRLCVRCFKKIWRDEGVHRCKGCRYAVYCDQQCQKADWPTHKAKNIKLEMDATQGLVRDHLSRLYGGSQEEIRQRDHARFEEWCRVHTFTLFRAATSALRAALLSTSLKGIALDRFLFRVELRPLLIDSDDPSRTFIVQRAEIRGVATAQEVAYFHADGMAEYLKEVNETCFLRARDDWNAADRYRGVLPMECVYGRYPIQSGVPILDPLPQSLPQNDSDVTRWKKWLPTFQAMALQGHVVGPMEFEGMKDIDTMSKMGTMQKLGGEWEWVQMSDDDARRFGYSDILEA
ncbi:hypothetical protein EWM64_g5386 [Hericium alpestre]|uniref:MYND-type domain-containing protein n=1 Tax=Hericium alpestre TaxID=135208 RepID=A0A4Y9ZX78_9AGAM|nr:hypothetical protein EWM64_g5386 [Hericium alpestre]